MTFYKWKSKFGGMGVSDARRLKALEDENARLKKLLAGSVLNKTGFTSLPQARAAIAAIKLGPPFIHEA